MTPWVVSRLFYPLHERFFNRRTFSLLNELEDSQWWSRDELRAFQARKLASLIQHVNAHCPFYAARMTRANFKTTIGDPLDELARWPLLDKSTIRKHFPELTWRVRGDRARRMATGGSTGEPLVIWVDRWRRSFDKAARMRTHRWFGVEPGDREAYLWGATVGQRRQDVLRAGRDWLLNDLLLSVFDLSKKRCEAYLKSIERFKPACLFGYPSSIERLCTFALEAGRKTWPSTLQAVFVTGEILDPATRKTIGDFFHVPVADGYGGRDFGFCAHECPMGSLHITDEHVVVEIVDEQGDVVPAGQHGEIIVTNLDNLATPLIRYRTGDMGSISPNPCRCGRGLGVLEMIHGRRSDHLVALDGSLQHALSVIYVMRDLSAIKQFRIHQQADRSVDVHIVPHGRFLDQAGDQALNGLRKCLGSGLDARLHVVPQIDSHPSGKWRYVTSEAV